jgi:hypothetical protein
VINIPHESQTAVRRTRKFIDDGIYSNCDAIHNLRRQFVSVSTPAGGKNLNQTGIDFN